jgi:hypothetical protein
MDKIIGYTGGVTRENHWPHPMNENFNKIIRNSVKIYGVGRKEDADLLKNAKNYLHSRIQGLINHKIKRDTEQYYQAMKLSIVHGYNKSEQERQKLIEESSFVLFVGEWRSDDECTAQYKFARMYSKPVFEMQYKSSIPLGNIVRYLQPVRPIKDTYWDPSKMDDVLIYETPQGLLELIDGNHRHEFANRVGGVQYLSGWIIKEA